MQLEHYASALHEYIVPQLTAYIKRLQNDGPHTATKEVNDTIWGTIALTPLEAMVLDSPLLQRLRRIRQLGVVHWIYPGAGHTRFEHTLGVVHQTQQLINALNGYPDPSQDGEAKVEYALAQLMRLAAIHHDIGHGPFSHVSEHPLEQHPSVQQILREFEEKHELERAKLSEVSAYLIIHSQPYMEFVNFLFGQVEDPPRLSTKSSENAKVVCELMGDAIIGKRVSQKIPLLHEVLNGPFDADKIDYMNRDAVLCGIPHTVDISRLSQKLTARDVHLSDLPANLKRSVAEGEQMFTLLGVKASGASVLDELALGRILLYSKVYRHHKVRAAEAMIEATFRCLDNVTSEADLVAIYYSLTDDEFLNLTSGSFNQTLRSKGITAKKDASAQRCKKTSIDLVGRLRERNLFVKALAIQSKYLGDPLGEDHEQSTGLMLLCNELKKPVEVGRFKEKIVELLIRLLENLEPEILSDYDKSTIFHYISISQPNQPVGGSEISRALVFPPNGNPVVHSEANMNTDAWARAYSQSQAVTGFIFCPRELSPFAYVAAEHVLLTQFGIILPDSALDISKQNREQIEKIKTEAAAFGFYQGAERQLLPTPPILRNPDITDRIREVAVKFSKYQEPVDVSEKPSAAPMEKRIQAWLAQFGEVSLIEVGLTMLEATRIVSRGEMVQGLKEHIEKWGGSEKPLICPIGTAKDSGAIVGYFSGDLSENLIQSVMTLQEALKYTRDRPILLVDDFCASGGQIVDVLATWFDRPDLRKNLGEQRLPLDQEELKEFRRRKVGFHFHAAWESGIKQLKEALVKLEVDAELSFTIPENQIPFAFEGKNAIGNTTACLRFKKRAEEIGQQIIASQMASVKGAEISKKSKERALGHGNRAMLLVFPYNVPSQTITLLRESGSIDGAEWRALLRRRKKK